MTDSSIKPPTKVEAKGSVFGKERRRRHPLGTRMSATHARAHAVTRTQTPRAQEPKVKLELGETPKANDSGLQEYWFTHILWG